MKVVNMSNCISNFFPVKKRIGKIGCKTCKHIACVCTILSSHEPECKFRKAATCVVGIECEHNRDCCFICDPCTCNKE